MSTNQTEIRTLVVKIGTTLLSGPAGFDGRLVEAAVKDLAHLKHDHNYNILIVSSGAVGCGMHALGIKERPRELPLKQATASVGQSRLMHYYESLFQRHGQGLHAAQVLLSANDLDNRQSYLNVRNTIKTLFELVKIVPIVNENDSTATDELKFGDNDTLAAKLAAKIDADLLIILSDVDGLYDKDPSKYSTAKLLREVDSIDDVEGCAGDTVVETSVGGMRTKLAAARIAIAAGVPVVIANGHRAHIIPGVLNGAAPFTRFVPSRSALSHRKRWIAFGRTSKGMLEVDDGAREAVLKKGRSLLAAGIRSVDGAFDVGAAVRIKDRTGHILAVGLVNYSSDDINRIKGCKSSEIARLLGRKDFDEVIHRDNLVVL